MANLSGSCERVDVQSLPRDASRSPAQKPRTKEEKKYGVSCWQVSICSVWCSGSDTAAIRPMKKSRTALFALASSESSRENIIAGVTVLNLSNSECLCQVLWFGDLC